MEVRIRLPGAKLPITLPINILLLPLSPLALPPYPPFPALALWCHAYPLKQLQKTASSLSRNSSSSQLLPPQKPLRYISHSLFSSSFLFLFLFLSVLSISLHVLTISLGPPSRWQLPTGGTTQPDHVWRHRRAWSDLKGLSGPEWRCTPLPLPFLLSPLSSLPSPLSSLLSPLFLLVFSLCFFMQLMSMIGRIGNVGSSYHL